MNKRRWLSLTRLIDKWQDQRLRLKFLGDAPIEDRDAICEDYAEAKDRLVNYVAMMPEKLSRKRFEELLSAYAQSVVEAHEAQTSLSVERREDAYKSFMDYVKGVIS